MSHEVETMFYVREEPWHGLGTGVEKAPDSEAALTLAGLAWGVAQMPVAVDGRVLDDYRANVRMTDRKVLGIVGERYRVLQNREAFNFTDALLGNGVKYETAGSLYGGKQVWILARLPQPVRLLGDEVAPYLCFTNSHDGEGAVRAVVTPVRVVCRNTLNLALAGAQRSWSTPHTGGIFDRLGEAARTLELTDAYLKSLKEAAEELAALRLSDEAWHELVEHLLPVRASGHGHEKHQEGVRRRREFLSQLQGAADLANYRGTGWGAINAVADYAGQAFTRPATDSARASRFGAIIDGHDLVDKGLAWLKDRFSLAV
ncbi:MAG: DUF932 domain-containing protein [Symbiobacteriia bacterium]